MNYARERRRTKAMMMIPLRAFSFFLPSFIPSLLFPSFLPFLRSSQYVIHKRQVKDTNIFKKGQFSRERTGASLAQGGSFRSSLRFLLPKKYEDRLLLMFSGLAFIRVQSNVFKLSYRYTRLGYCTGRLESTPLIGELG